MGRWFASQLVRWSEGAMQPIGGWARVQDTTGDIDLDARIASLFAWKDNAFAAYLLAGTPGTVSVLTGGELTDLTIAEFTPGLIDAALSTGDYGAGAYGIGAYGTGSETEATLTEAQTWQFDNFGEIPVAVAHSDGRMLDWDLNAANNFVVVANAPVDNLGVVVTAERFLVALGAGGDPRLVAWSDQEARTVWTPLDTNQAGDFPLTTTGEIMCGTRGRGETLIFTSTDLHAMRFIGGPLVYSFAQVGSNCGIISRQAFAQAEGRTIWMGRRSFFSYDGVVSAISCEISDAIFSDFNTIQRSKVVAVPIPDFHEMLFLYPSASSTENDRAALYNYLEGHWSGPWELRRSAGVPSGVFDVPILGGDEGSMFSHEFGTSYDEPLTQATGNISAGAALDDGDQVIVGAKTYTFKTTIASANDVALGGSNADAFQNLAAAINFDSTGATGGGGEGAAYGTGTTVNLEASAVFRSATPAVDVTALHRGPNGNDIIFDIGTDPDADLVLAPSGGFLTGGADVALLPSAESGPLEIGSGDQLMTINSIIPDENSLGSVDLTLFVAAYPTATEDSQVLATSTEPTDSRLSGRQVRLKLVQSQPLWRFGIPRLEVVPRGRR